MSKYRETQFIKDHAFQVLQFYEPICKDKENGGFFCTYNDDGQIYDKKLKDLVSACRFDLNFSYGILLTGKEEYKDLIRHGFEFIEMVHRDNENGGYYQRARGHKAERNNKMTYVHAFYLFALSTAFLAGIHEVESRIEEVFNFLENKMWDSKYKLYIDETTPDFTEIHPYRGQNCNMHMVEAVLGAYDATYNDKYLNRAYDIAHKIAGEFTKESNGLVWEHYTSDWEIDWSYNKNANKYDLDNLLRPYGFSPGHQMCWARFLLLIEKYRADDWLLPTAEVLFEKTIEYAWDKEKGGINQAFDMDGSIVDSDRRFWTHAETISTAALLALRTGKKSYWEMYDKVWDYADKHFVDKKYGGWYRILSGDGKRLEENIKSPPPKTDYHVMSACYEILRAKKHYV